MSDRRITIIDDSEMLTLSEVKQLKRLAAVSKFGNIAVGAVITVATLGGIIVSILREMRGN